MGALKETLFVARSGEGMFADGMWIFYVEALLVLALGAFIVWWTMPKKRPPAPLQQAAVQSVESSARKALTGEASANEASGTHASGNQASGNQGSSNQGSSNQGSSNQGSSNQASANKAAAQPASGNTTGQD